MEELVSSTQIENSSPQTSLVKANHALRNQDYLQALKLYFEVFQEHPSIFRSLAVNIYYVQKQLLSERLKLEDDLAVICTWNLFSPKTRSRTLTLANLYRANHFNVQVFDCLPPGSLHQADVIEGIPVKSLSLPNQEILLNQILEFVIGNPCKIMHLTSVELPNLLLGALYKTIWGSRVMVDLDHRTMLALGNAFPIINIFDGITVTNPDLQSRYGGWVFSEPSDIAYIPAIRKVRTTTSEALNSLVEIQFESIAKILTSLHSLPVDSYLLKDLLLNQATSAADEQAALNRIRDDLKKEIKFIEDLGYLSFDPFEAANYLFTPKSHQSFLANLFSAALGRAPKEHEANHYGGLLDRSEKTRLEMADIVLTGPESKGYMTQLERGFFVKQKFTLPTIGGLKPEDIKLPLYEKPIISILIPVYCKLEYTLACLKSIADYLPKVSFEILVLDDRSPDDSVQELKKIKNIQVVVNPENLGFTTGVEISVTGMPVRSVKYFASIFNPD
jgi:hypothetical protein